MMNQEHILHQIMTMPVSEQAALAYALDNYLADQIPDQIPAQFTTVDPHFLSELERRSTNARAQIESLNDAKDVLATLRQRQQSEPSQ